MPVNDLNSMPCDSEEIRTIEQELLIPQKDYEECDTCAPYDEMPQGEKPSDEEVTALITELQKIADDSQNADDEFVKNMEECVKKITDKVDAISGQNDVAMSAAVAYAKIDELLENFEPYEYYYRMRKEFIMSKTKNTLNETVSASEITEILNSLPLTAMLYSSAIKISTVNTQEPTANNITEYSVKYKYRMDLYTDAESKLSNKLTEIASASYIDISKDTELTGVLYTEYYNKLKDPLNIFFTPEERGLTTNMGMIDADLVLATNSQSLQLDQIATAKQGDETYFIKDQKLFISFFIDFEKKYENKVLQIHTDKINPVLDALKSAMRKIALFETQTGNINSANTDAVLAYFDYIREQRNRLNSVFTNFKDSVKVDINNPGDNPLAKSMMESTACLGGEADHIVNEKDNTEYPEFVGDMADTFKYAEGDSPGMSADAPNPTKSCYWKKFAKLATTYGLLPFPDLQPKTPGQGLRYWPVGLIIPTPAMLIKIPLPVVWIPLITITSKFGIIVIFLGVNGILPCPYVMYIGKGGIKTFVVTMRGPSKSFGYKAQDTDIGYPIKIRIPFALSLAALDADLRNLILAANKKGFPPFDEFTEDIKKSIFTAIDNAGLPKSKNFDKIKIKLKKIADKTENLDFSVNDIYDAIQKDASDWVNDMNLPKITLPKDKGQSASVPNIVKVIQQAIDFYSNKFVMPQLKMFDFKEKIIQKVGDMLDDTDLKKEISKLPKELNVTNEEDVKKFNAFMKKVIDKLEKKFLPDPWNPQTAYNVTDRCTLAGNIYISAVDNNVGVTPYKYSSVWIKTDELMKGSLMMPSISIGNPFKCKETLLIPEFDLAFLAAVKAAFAMIKSILGNLSGSDISGVIGFKLFKTDNLLILVYEMIDKLIPSIPLPNLLSTNFIKVFKKMAMDAMATDMPTLDLLSGLIPKSITIDLDVIKSVLVGIVVSMLRSMLPVFDLSSPQAILSILSLSMVELKQIIKSMIESAMDTIAAPIKPAYNTASAVFSAAKFISDQKSTLDGAMSPLDLAKSIATSMIKVAKDILKGPLDGTLVIPPEVLEVAMELLKKLSFIPFPVVGAAGAFGAGPAIRLVHPLLYEDDLPPWERLNLKNMLFVLFLDEFCHTAKQQGGFFENYLP